jgi:radical SAM protein with 4Fe4S-binding SPASM domain
MSEIIRHEKLLNLTNITYDRKNVFPFGHIDIELTERCNNACIHCLINQPEHDADKQTREMSTADVKDILRQASNLGYLTVRFTGGEPLLRDDFAELYLFARQQGMYVILFTNARRITPELSQIMKHIPPGRAVEVTIYGLSSESYDAVTASRGAFDEFQRGIDLLRGSNVPFIVKNGILRPNHAETTEYELFAATLTRSNKKNVGHNIMDFDLRARRDDPLKNHFIENLRYTPDEIVTMLVRKPGYVEEMRRFCSKFIGPPGDKLFTCGAGYGMCIDAYGMAQMCMGLRHPDMVFNLRGDAITAVKSDSPLRYALTEFFPRLRETQARNTDYLNRCARCFLKGLCEQCPAKAWMEYGTLDTPVDYSCKVAHAQARYLGLVAENENAWEVVDWSERISQFAGNV